MASEVYNLSINPYDRIVKVTLIILNFFICSKKVKSSNFVQLVELKILLVRMRKASIVKFYFSRLQSFPLRSGTDPNRR